MLCVGDVGFQSSRAVLKKRRWCGLSSPTAVAMSVEGNFKECQGRVKFQW